MINELKFTDTILISEFEKNKLVNIKFTIKKFHFENVGFQSTLTFYCMFINIINENCNF